MADGKVDKPSTSVDPTSPSWARPVLTNARLAVEVFDGTGHFGMWQSEVLDALFQQGLDIAIEEKVFKDQDLALILLGSLLEEYKLLETTLLTGKDGVSLSEACAALYGKELRRKDKQISLGGDTEVLLVRGNWKRDCPKLKTKDNHYKGKAVAEANVTKCNDEESDLSLATSSTNNDSNVWLLDSACSHHITPHREWFNNFEEHEEVFKDQDLALILLGSLPEEYELLETTLLTGKDGVSLSEVCAALYGKELRRKDKQISLGGDTEVLLVRGRSQKKGTDKRWRSKSRQRLSKDECAFCHEKGNWKRDCPKLKTKDNHYKGKAVAEANVTKCNDEESDLSLATSSTNNASNVWLLDSACSHHITPHREWFNNFEEHEEVVYTADETPLTTHGIGSVRLQNEDGTIMTLKAASPSTRTQLNLLEQLTTTSPSAASPSTRTQLNLLEQLTTTSPSGSGSDGNYIELTIREKLVELVGDCDDDFSMRLGKKMRVPKLLTVAQKRNIKRQSYLNEVSSTLSPLCNSEIELLDHYLVNCPLVKLVSAKVGNWWGVDLSGFSLDDFIYRYEISFANKWALKLSVGYLVPCLVYLEVAE
ncbi:Retrovirus-related Pol polyprotein from transposon TNT 1-94 [Artemisia annua]|uniref:Retrovirus-related Pol polyprotein from transposon TNT 1-94 n=1 Tax=Artemisia annua TaxID=35608 RepID=A0A2U1MKM8_ARTAN|nr:Retrovirus-related Pol polyprotein from transposon TNT 1-94 [Artemisia annua]